MSGRCFALLVVASLLGASPVSAGPISFLFTFDADAAGIAGQAGTFDLSIRSNISSPVNVGVFSDFVFPSPGVLGPVVFQTCTPSGSLATALELPATDFSSPPSFPALPACLHHQAISAFPSMLSVVATASEADVPVELELSIGNASGFFVGAAVAYFNTDSTGSGSTGWTLIPGHVTLFASRHFTATALPVPEPGSTLLLISSLACVGVRRAVAWRSGRDRRVSR